MRVGDSEIVELDRRGLAYVKAQLESGHTLSLQVLQSVDPSKGLARALVPWVARDRLDGVYEFEQSLMLTMGVSDWDSDSDLVKLLHAYLHGHRRRIAVFEDPNRTRRNLDWLLRQDVRVGVYNDEVYFLATEYNRESPERLRDSFSVPRAWLLVGVLSSISYVPSSDRSMLDLHLEDLRTIAERTEHIVVNAYDNESFVVWSRNAQDSLLTG